MLNLCIDPKWQQKGYGSLLLEHTINFVARKRNEAMFLEVRISNPGAISLYENRGFVIVGRRPDYYQASEGREDAIVMRLELASESASSP